MAERLPPGTYDPECARPAFLPNGLEANGVHYPDANGGHHLRSDSVSGPLLGSPVGSVSSTGNGTQVTSQLFREPSGINGTDANLDSKPSNGNGGLQTANSVSETVDGRESRPLQDGENAVRSKDSASIANGNQVEAEWIEQYEPGVYITLVALRDGTRDLKRVRFR